MTPRFLVMLAWSAAAASLPASAQTLFGLRNPGDGGRQLVVVDPAGGAVSPVSASISPPLGTASGVTALDASGGRFFFVGTASGEVDARLYTVDTQTGAVLASPLLSGSATAFVNALEYEAGAGVLYGLRNPGDGGRQLVTLDPASGAVTPLGGSISPPLPGASGVSALDASGQRFFFVGTPSGETDARLYAIDTPTGAVLSSPTLVGSATAFVEALEYEAGAGVLYGLRNPGDGGRQLVTLDPASGDVTPVSASISPPLPGSSGISALDADGARFFFIGTASGESDARLFSVDTQTGAVLASPSLAGSASAFFQGLAFAPDQGPQVLTIVIDIHPGSFPNPINVRKKGVIPVAILTTDGFDATTVNVATLRFGPGQASEAHGRGHLEDVDADGDLDMVLHFRALEAAIPCGATSATLAGETLAGQAVAGSDSVVTVGCRR